MTTQATVLKRLEDYVELVNKQRAIVREIRKLVKEALTIHKQAEKAVNKLDKIQSIQGPDQFGDIEDLEVFSLFSEGAYERSITTESLDTLGDVIFSRAALREVPSETGARKILDYALTEDNSGLGYDDDEDDDDDEDEDDEDDEDEDEDDDEDDDE